MPYLPALLLLLPLLASAGADTASSGTTEVLHAGQVVVNTLEPRDRRQELSVKLSAYSPHHRISVTFWCHGGYPAIPPYAVFLLGPWSNGDSRGIYVRGRDGAEHVVLEPRIKTVPGTDGHIFHLEDPERLHALARIVLHSGVLIHDEASRFSVGDSPERLQGARTLLESCLRLHLDLPGWYLPPPGTSMHLNTDPSELSRMASDMRVEALNACTTDGRPASRAVRKQHSALLLATGHHAILASSPDRPGWEWLALRDWYNRLASACAAAAR